MYTTYLSCTHTSPHPTTHPYISLFPHTPYHIPHVVSVLHMWIHPNTTRNLPLNYEKSLKNIKNHKEILQFFISSGFCTHIFHTPPPTHFPSHLNFFIQPHITLYFPHITIYTVFRHQLFSHFYHQLFPTLGVLKFFLNDLRYIEDRLQNPYLGVPRKMFFVSGFFWFAKFSDGRTTPQKCTLFIHSISQVQKR